MNKGDTLRLILDISYKGKDFEEGQFDEIELQLNRENFGKYNVKKLLSKGEIVWDSDLKKYVTYIDQEDCFKFPNKVEYQVRCMNDGSVVSSNIGAFFIGDTLSRQVLGYEQE